MELLRQIGFTGKVVCDPVFLLSKEEWLQLVDVQNEGKHIFVYDFDHSPVIQNLLSTVNDEIVSYFSMPGVTAVDESGPINFLRNIATAKLIISNSFHATAFALIFNKPFYVVERQENLNARLYDLLSSVGLSDRIVRSIHDTENIKPIEWNRVNHQLKPIINKSKDYLDTALKEKS